MADYTIADGDNAPDLIVDLAEIGGVDDLDVSDATSIVFQYRVEGDVDPENIVEHAVTAESATRVRVAWGADAPEAGYYFGRFVVSWDGPRVESFPNNAWIAIRVST